MLDQVKSGTSARIAVTRPTGGPAPGGQAPVSQRVNPSSADNGVDQDSGHGGLPERGGGDGVPGEQETSSLSSQVTARALALPKTTEARASVDNALQRLLREARDLRREEKPAAVALVAAGGDEAPGAFQPETFQKATNAYSQQETLRGRTDVLRPGVVFSASF